MQSSNFVEGVSGWRIADGRIELYGGLAPIILEKAPEPEQPFAVVDGVTYIGEAAIKDASITMAKIADNWSVKMEATAGGQQYFASFGPGLGLHRCMCAVGYEPGAAMKAGGIASAIGSQFVVSPDRFTIKGATDLETALAKGDAKTILDMLSGKIDKTELGLSLKEEIESKQGAQNRALNERISSLEKKLGELHTLLGETNDHAKREMAESILRELDRDKSSGAFGTFKSGPPFGGFPGAGLSKS